MNNIKPVKLTKGSTIGIVSVSAPEAAMEPEWFKRGAMAIEQHGYKVRIGSVAIDSHGYLSAEEKLMADDLNTFFQDDEIAAIICAGGGTNANRLLRHLDYEMIGKNPKIFVGISNPSVLLNAIYAKTGLVTFHGPTVVWNFGSPSGLPEYTASHFWPLVEGTYVAGAILPRDKWSWWRNGKTRGRLIGGNLTSIEGLLGTPWAPEWKNSVLFWEDIGKPINRLDMTLTHFRDAGVFDGISGMIIGELVNCASPEGGQTFEEMLHEVIGDFSFPVLTHVDLGHTDDKITLPIGIEAELDSEHGIFSFLETGVR